MGKQKQKEQMNHELEITTPKPYQVVGVKFDLFGKVPKSWLSHGRYGLGVDWLDSNGNDLPMSGPNSTILPSLFPWSKKVRFHAPVDLSYFTISEHPRGLILVIEIYEGDRQSFYHPVIIQGTNTSYDSELEELKEKLSGSIKKIIKRKEDWKNYSRELGELRKSIVDNREILQGMFEILEQSEENFEPIPQIEEEIQEAELQEKYKEAIETRGPLLRGLAGRMDGFEMRVYSNDHGQHFHVVHKGKGINARFSFPDIQLINYVKAKTMIGTKTEQKIREYCLSHDVFSKIQAEFAKRY